MPTVDERIGQVEKMIPDLRDEMRRSFDSLARRFDEVERRFEQVDKRFEQVDKRFDWTDQRLDRLESRVERLDEKIEKGFRWIVTAQFTMMVIFIGALVAAILRTS